MTEKLKIGIIDLLTILLPGAFLLIIFEKKFRTFLTPTSTPNALLSVDWIFVAMFLSVAYTLGHFIFFISSFLDDLIYEKVKKVYWQNHDALVAYILKIKERETGITDRNILSAFKWSTTYLLSKEPAIYGEVEKYLAESKFFRSLVTVMLLTSLVIKEYTGTIRSISFVLLFAFLSLVRYLTQRQKSLQTAYHGILSTCHKLNSEERTTLLQEKPVQQNLLSKISRFRLMDKRRKSNTRLRWIHQLCYLLLKFLLTVGLCLIPGFESLVLRKRKSKKAKR